MQKMVWKFPCGNENVSNIVVLSCRNQVAFSVSMILLEFSTEHFYMSYEIQCTPCVVSSKNKE